MAQPLTLAYANGHPLLLPAMANRHGLITGATGTGKTVTLQVLAEGFLPPRGSRPSGGREGDLSGPGAAGMPSPSWTPAWPQLGIPAPAFAPSSDPVMGPVCGAGTPGVGHRLSDMGPPAARQPARPQRHLRAACWSWCSRWRTTRAAAARSERPARHGAVLRGTTPRPSPPATATCPPPPSCHPAIPLTLESGGGSLRRAHAGHSGSCCCRPTRPGNGHINVLAASKLHPVQPASTPVSVLAAVLSCSNSCPRWGSGETRAGVLRRGSPVVQRRPQGAAGKDRAGGAPSSARKEWALHFVTQSSGRHSRQRAGSLATGSTPCAFTPSGPKAVRTPPTPCAPTWPSTRLASSPSSGGRPWSPAR